MIWKDAISAAAIVGFGLLTACSPQCPPGTTRTPGGACASGASVESSLDEGRAQRETLRLKECMDEKARAFAVCGPRCPYPYTDARYDDCIRICSIQRFGRSVAKRVFQSCTVPP